MCPLLWSEVPIQQLGGGARSVVAGCLVQGSYVGVTGETARRVGEGGGGAAPEGDDVYGEVGNALGAGCYTGS
jgi:hypothetical protein